MGSPESEEGRDDGETQHRVTLTKGFWMGETEVTQGLHPVAQKKANAWGLYDMHGNVWEWCADWYGAYPAGTAIDPTGPASGGYHVLRGGGFWNSPQDCRSADRPEIVPFNRYEDYGLRLLAFQDGR